MSQIYNDNTKQPKPKENQLGILEISAREFTFNLLYLVVQGSARLEHSIHIAKVGV